MSNPLLNASGLQLFLDGRKAANLFSCPRSAFYREVMSQREPMTDASLQQFLDDFIDSLATPSEDGHRDAEG